MNQMPEGWKRLVRARDQTYWKGESGILCPMTEDIDRTLVIIKDAAETLNNLISESDHIETQHATKQFWREIEFAKEALKGLKEWK